MSEAIPRIGPPEGPREASAESRRRPRLASWLLGAFSRRPAGPRALEGAPDAARGARRAPTRPSSSAEALSSPIRTLVDPRDIYLA